MVSIILCTYNRARLIPAAIRSVVKQSYPDWELIIIDDGSSDGTHAVVKDFLREDKRIRYYFQKNKGLAAARNRGLANARGEFICFVDSDDALAPMHLKKRVDYFQRYPSVDFLHGGMTLIGPKKKRYVVDLTNKKKKIHLSRCHVGGTFFFRKTILKRIKGFRSIPFGEDFDLYKRVEKYFIIRKVGFPTYRYHLDSENRLCDLFTEELYNKKARRSL